MPVVADGNVFLQGAALRAQRQQAEQSNMMNTLKFLVEARNAGGQDLVKKAEAAAYKKASGLEVTPEEDALASGWDRIRSTEMAIDPTTGNPYPKASPLFEQMAGAASQGYTPMFGPKNDVFPEGFQNGSIDAPTDLDLPMAPMSPAQIQDLVGQNIYQDAPIEDTKPKVDTSVADDMIQESGMANNPKQKAELFSAGLDAKKATATEAAKADLANQESERKKSAGKEVFQKSLDRMAEITDELKEMGALPIEGGGLMQNSMNIAKAKVPAVGNATGDKAQALRDEFMSLRNQLGNAVMAADGMSSKQMDSNAEREAFMKSLGAPDLSYDANVSIQRNLGTRYGTGEPKRKGEKLKTLKDKYGLD